MKAKKLIILLFFIALFAMVGCSTTKSVEYITDFERFADMQETADSIDVEFDNHTGRSFKFTLEDENDIADIMNIVLTEELTNIGNGLPPVGDNTQITIHQGEKSYTLSVRHNREKDTYYAFSFDLQSKVIDLATARGAYDTEVGVIYKVIDLQEIESIKEEKITVADKTAMLSLLGNGYADCEYFYLYDSRDLAEQYYSSDITENELAAYQWKGTVTMGKNKLLLMYHIYQNYNAVSYYITGPSLGEYVDNGNTMNIELAFGLWHYAYLNIYVVS